MTQTILDNQFATVSKIALADSATGLTINHKTCQASVSLYGGQVLSYQPLGHKPMLWLSKSSSYQQGKAIRGGIPLCWPWFGENDKQSATEAKLKPADKHGFARQVTWQVESISADEQALTLVLIFQGENQHSLWPNACQLKQTLVFGTSLTQTLTMTNLSTIDAQYTGALHSYFSVSNPENITVPVLEHAKFDDKLTAKHNNEQALKDCVGPIDRIYYTNEKVALVDKGWQRKIEITSNCSQWVLWNPGVELANIMADIHDNGEQEYVCLEAANTKWQPLPAGQSVTMSQEIKVSAIS